jgi:epoxyqueuosine reductase
VLIAIGNSGDPSLLPAVRQRLSDASELVRAMAVWALSRLESEDEFATLKARFLPGETDGGVRDEWLASAS